MRFVHLPPACGSGVMWGRMGLLAALAMLPAIGSLFKVRCSPNHRPHGYHILVDSNPNSLQNSKDVEMPEWSIRRVPVALISLRLTRTRFARELDLEGVWGMRTCTKAYLFTSCFPCFCFDRAQITFSQIYLVVPLLQ
jgi:hypothetical protein